MDEGSIKTIGRYSYYMEKCLGEGSFGKVFEGFQNTTKEKVAIKKVDFKTIEKDAYLEKAIHDEIRILNKFKHENIVQLHEVLNSKRSLYIIMEFCKEGDLKKLLKTRKRIPDEEAYQIMKQIVRGYQELAKNNTTHRDLKPANILISQGCFKICDFGFSKVIKDPNTALKTCVGSPIYMAPQILEKKDYSAKCDIWSLGVIYYEVLHGNVPWVAKNQKQLLQNIKRAPIKFNSSLGISEGTQKMIKSMLEVREQNRASLKDLQEFFNIEFAEGPTSSPCISTSPSIPASTIKERTSSQTNFQRTMTTISTKVLNRHYFEELSWRYFVCIQLKSRLPVLNGYNIRKNSFEKLLILIVSSIMCNFSRREAEIQKIHEREAVEIISLEHEFHRQLEEQLLEEGRDIVFDEILNEPDYRDLRRRNFTPDNIKKFEGLLLKKVEDILEQLESVIRTIDEKIERNMLLYVCELLLDLLLINDRQAKTGMADVGRSLKDRNQAPIEKRVSSKKAKMVGFTNAANTQFF